MIGRHRIRSLVRSSGWGTVLLDLSGKFSNLKGMEDLTQRYAKSIKGVLDCYDRIVLFGSFRTIAYAEAMSKHLHFNGVKLVDYAKSYANELRLGMVERVRGEAERQGVDIRHVGQSVRKEALVESLLQRRGRRAGLVCILSAMESCSCYKCEKNHQSGYLELRWSQGKCLHYYIYWMDEVYGLCYLRIPTWAPFRLQVYFNGHDWLERRMKSEGIRFNKIDNCFCHISDFDRANKIARQLDPAAIHERLAQVARQYVGVYELFGHELHWSIHQAEWATDIVFKNDRVLPELYDQIVRTAAVEIRCPDVYDFLGKRLTKRSGLDVSSRLQTLMQGRRIKHTLGSTSLKMYDKHDRVLRIETTTSNVSTFTCYRKVESRAKEHRDPRRAPIRKTLYSLGALAEAMQACNKRYRSFISALPDRTAERHKLSRVTQSVRDQRQRSYRGVNFFAQGDLIFLHAILRGEHHIQGLRNRSLQPFLPGWNSQKIGRTLRRFKVLGLLKKVRGTVKYYITSLGKDVLVAALQLRERVVIPALRAA